jgi:hypothetical protein
MCFGTKAEFTISYMKTKILAGSLVAAVLAIAPGVALPAAAEEAEEEALSRRRRLSGGGFHGGRLSRRQRLSRRR